MDGYKSVQELLGQIMDIINTLEEQDKANKIAELLGAISAANKTEALRVYKNGKN